jgi:hypothetical protein
MLHTLNAARLYFHPDPQMECVFYSILIKQNYMQIPNGIIGLQCFKVA